MRWLASIGLALVSVAGCLVPFDDYPVSEPGVGGTGGSADGAGGNGASGAGGAGTAGSAGAVDGAAANVGCDGSGASCATGTTETPLPPAGWSGPVALTSGDPGASAPCPGGYSELELGHSTLVSPTTCECECAAGVECSATVKYFGKALCATGVGTASVFDEITTCLPVDVSAQTVSVVVDGSCKPPSKNSGPPAASFSMEHRICAPLTPPECTANGACVPDGAPALCVFRDGDHACVEGPYSSKLTVHDSLSDDRVCTGCACTSAGSACSANVGFHLSDKGCASPLGQTCTATSALPACCSLGGSPVALQSVSAALFQGGSTCQPTQPTVVGTVELTGTRTLCCIP